MLVHRRVTPSIKFAGTHLYTWVERGTLRVKCLAQEHNTMSPARARSRTARSGDERTNHEATAWTGPYLLFDFRLAEILSRPKMERGGIMHLHNQSIGKLKDPSQSFKLLILHGEVKSYCFTASCVPESMFNYFW